MSVMFFNMNQKKIIIPLSVIMLLLVIAANVELPLPAGVSANSTVIGTVESCDREKYSGGKVGPALTFVGVNLGNSKAPYLRWNPEDNDNELVDKICNERLRIKVWYRASRLIIRPHITYWIDSIEVL